MLEGIIASEGNVHVRSDSGRLGEISIAAKDEDKRKFIRELLLNLGIQPSKDKTISQQEAVLIHGLSNFRKVDEWNLVSLHPKKFADFKRGLNGFKKEEFRKGEGKLKILMLLKDGKKTVLELTNLLNRKRRTISKSLAELERKGLVKRERSSRKIFWIITDEGRKILEVENPLKMLRSCS
jgi:DNA-binding MarR family transcriptional regulator